MILFLAQARHPSIAFPITGYRGANTSRLAVLVNFTEIFITTRIQPQAINCLAMMQRL